MDVGDTDAGFGDGVRVSVFDESVENHFKALETISKLCGEEEEVTFLPEDSEFQRLSSSIRFLREWKQFEYQPRKVKFASEVGGSHGKCVTGEAILPQFSSATVPKVEDGFSGSSNSLRDFVLYVGGSVWALDWCPRVQREPDNPFKCEFLAVAAHPPESYYHKVGAPLTGRGMVQIWCVLNTSDNVEAPTIVRKMRQAAKSTKEPGRPRGRPRKKVEESPDGGAIKKPRGRPRKKPAGDCPSSSGFIEKGVAVQDPGCSTQLVALDRIPEITEECTNGSNKRNKRKSLVEPTSGSIAAVKTPNGSKLEEDPGALKKPRGRARKKAVDVHPDPLGCTERTVQCSEGTSELLTLEGTPGSTQECADQSKNRERRKTFTVVASSSNKSLTVHCQSRTKKKIEPKCVGTVTSNQHGNKSTSPLEQDTDKNSEQGAVATQSVLDLAVYHAEGPPELLALEEDAEKNQEHARQGSTSKRRKGSAEKTSNNSALKTAKQKISRRGNASQSACDATACTQNENECLSPVNHQISNSSELAPLTDQSGHSMDTFLIQNGNERASMGDQIQANHDVEQMVTIDTSNNQLFDKGSASCALPNDVALPRVVFCLAHNGKVVWDLKWRHQKISSSCCLYRMGYLAVLLGNGSLEVWDIPLPHAMKQIYCSSHEDGTDPRFVKLEPVFRCSRIKCGEMQSIPLTVEWSSQDLLLVGCHDGTVALLKFSPTGEEDSRPLLCFSADTVPIRAVAWAPVESDQEMANVILTAGHVGLKFWDIRDPFRPLWDLHPAPKFIYSLDWVSDPKCVMLSFDDGTMRLLSLVKAANDAPVNGNPTVGPKQHGLHIFNCSSFAIWSVQVSKLTGMIAYCSADGTVNRFQLTSKVVEKEPGRHRVPHFVCGFLSQEESAIVVNTPVPATPLSSKKPVNEIKNEMAVSTSTKSSHNKTTNSGKANSSSDHQPLALCYGDDPGVESAPEETLASVRRKRKSKSASSIAKDHGKDRALMLVGEDQDSLPEKAVDKAEAADQTETMPPKIVAMHRVRWNMNRGSERWLCSGGAAGVVRCQEIIMTEFDTHLAKKR